MNITENQQTLLRMIPGVDSILEVAKADTFFDNVPKSVLVRSIRSVVIWNVVAANGQYHGGGMWVAPDASVCDGLLHVTIIGDLTIPEVFLNLSKLYNGRIYDIDKVIPLTGKKVAAISDDRVLLEVDGEQPGMLPMVVKIAPGALNIIAN